MRLFLWLLIAFALYRMFRPAFAPSGMRRETSNSSESTAEPDSSSKTRSGAGVQNAANREGEYIEYEEIR